MALKHIFQDTPTIKMLDFLIDHKGYDYSKTEIAENSGIGWTTLNRHWDILEEWEFVIETRKIGRATLYKLNEENPVVKKLLAFDKEATAFMSEKVAEGELSKAKKSDKRRS
ncbi:MAG: winged helix-turn-helix domain-containing protein [Halobacteriota archaeon]|nr:winged helix-turn-helix domain-containing protein [Halobacteriota archaeon]